MPGLNLQRVWRFYSFDFSAFSDQFEKLYQTLEKVFYQRFSLFKYRYETLFLVLIYYLKFPRVFRSDGSVSDPKGGFWLNAVLKTELTKEMTSNQSQQTQTIQWTNQSK